MDFEKYIFIIDETVIAIESANKREAIAIFESKISELFNMNFKVKRVNQEVTIDKENRIY